MIIIQLAWMRKKQMCEFKRTTMEVASGRAKEKRELTVELLEFGDILRYQTEHRRRDVMVNNLKRKGRERYIIKSPSCMVGCMGSGKRLLLKRGYRHTKQLPTHMWSK